MQLSSPQDYRLRALSQAPVYQQPLGVLAEAALDKAFARLATAAPDPRPSLTINDREIPALTHKKQQGN